MDKRKRAHRYAVSIDPNTYRHFEADRGAWHESEEEIEAGLAWGREKARLMKWLRNQMGRRLTVVERRAIELYYFRNLTYRDAAQLAGTNHTSVYRAVRRGLRKLQAAAEQDGVTLELKKPKRDD